jgi:hypothetical protein
LRQWKNLDTHYFPFPPKKNLENLEENLDTHHLPFPQFHFKKPGKKPGHPSSSLPPVPLHTAAYTE